MWSLGFRCVDFYANCITGLYCVSQHSTKGNYTSQHSTEGDYTPQAGDSPSYAVCLSLCEDWPAGTSAQPAQRRVEPAGRCRPADPLALRGHSPALRPGRWGRLHPLPGGEGGWEASIPPLHHHIPRPPPLTPESCRHQRETGTLPWACQSAQLGRCPDKQKPVATARCIGER